MFSLHISAFIRSMGSAALPLYMALMPWGFWFASHVVSSIIKRFMWFLKNFLQYVEYYPIKQSKASPSVLHFIHTFRDISAERRNIENALQKIVRRQIDYSINCTGLGKIDKKNLKSILLPYILIIWKIRTELRVILCSKDFAAYHRQAHFLMPENCIAQKKTVCFISNRPTLHKSNPYIGYGNKFSFILWQTPVYCILIILNQIKGNGSSHLPDSSTPAVSAILTFYLFFITHLFSWLC